MDGRAHVKAFWFLLEWNLHHGFFILKHRLAWNLQSSMTGDTFQFPMTGIEGLNYYAHLSFFVFINVLKARRIQNPKQCSPRHFQQGILDLVVSRPVFIVWLLYSHNSLCLTKSSKV